MEWLTDNKIPIGDAVDAGFQFLDEHFWQVFDAISVSLSFVIESLTTLLTVTPPLIVIAVIAAIAYWLRRSWLLSVGTILSLMLVINLGFWETSMQTLALILVATAVCMVLGVPIGIAAAHRPWLSTTIRPVLDLMQTVPTFVYLIPTMVLFGLGVVPGLISTVIFAVPAPIRFTEFGIRSVPKPLLEAGESFGATKSQLLWKVELPHAMPAILQGLTQCIMLSLSMVVIAALVGAPGLGVPVVRALNTVDTPMGVEAAVAIVVIAIVLDRICRRQDKDSGGGH